jgi:hypothetical protein
VSDESEVILLSEYEYDVMNSREWKFLVGLYGFKPVFFMRRERISDIDPPSLRPNIHRYIAVFWTFTPTRKEKALLEAYCPNAEFFDASFFKEDAC